jgi:Holliday junction resolvase RusA-like endonuclease
MNITIKAKPLSVNSAWKGQRFKTKSYQEYERKLLFQLPVLKEKFDIFDMLRIEFVFGFSSNASDIDNPLKPTIDILCKKYGFDDKQIWELEVSKKIVAKGNEFINVTITKVMPF